MFSDIAGRSSTGYRFSSGPTYTPWRHSRARIQLYWQDHELAEHIRDEKLWEAAKRDVLGAVAVGFPFDVLRDRLRELATRRLD